MPTKFNVLLGEIQAALLFCSNDESRYVLNSVHFEIKPDRRPVLVSTDGRRLCVIESEAEPGADHPPIESPQNLTLSASFLSALIPFAKKNLLKILPLEIEYHPSVRAVFKMVDCFVDSEKGAVIDMPFPKWREALPSGTKEPVPELGLNAEYMADFSKAAKALSSPEGSLLRMNLFTAGGQIEVHLCGKPNFYGVVMPLEPKDEERNWQPEFLCMPKATQPIAVSTKL